MSGCQAKTDRSTIVLQIQDVVLEPDRFDPVGYDVRNVVECVLEFLCGRHAAQAKAWVIGSENVELILERGDQVAEHVR